MATTVVPIFIAFDLACAIGTTAADRAAEQAWPVVDTLRHDPELAGQVRIGVFGLAGPGSYQEPPWASPDIDVSLDDVPPAGRTGRPYAAALDGLRALAALDAAAGPAGPPLMLLITDRQPADDWRTALDDLTRDRPDARLVPIWYAPASRTPPPLPAYPGDVSPRHLYGPEQLQPAAIALAMEHLDAVRDGGHRATGSRAPARRQLPSAQWSGASIPYSVGDPGNAASRVRPLPDPTDWDRPDTVLDGVCLVDDAGVPTLELRAASVRGLSHRYYGTVRQDDYAFRCTTDNRYLVAVVSDGVSNSRLSHRAATLIARDGAATVAAILDRGAEPATLDWAGIARELTDRVIRLGEQVIHRTPDAGPLGCREAAAHLAATALFAVVGTQARGDDVEAHVFSIGDSTAWVLRDGGRWQAQQRLTKVGEAVASASVAAIPLQRPDVEPPVQIRLSAADVLVLMTDGVGDPLGDGTGAVGRFLAETWRRPPVALAFAAQVDFARKSHDDDRTVLAVWRAERHVD
ncbi:protein phosphatase 2C domain-containing protein [Solwaraspora sp. WMMB335]|uniref:protein phosphatase 2C domain-containing protein n=1 Tax=Solwaraspora sp. WMMB335 TaxID=3404118 RepID=UPI003B951D18